MGLRPVHRFHPWLARQGDADKNQRRLEVAIQGLPMKPTLWLLPKELRKAQETIALTGLTPKIGKADYCGDVPQIPYTFRTVREMNYFMFRLFGWFYKRTAKGRPAKRSYQWKGAAKGDNNAR